MSIKALLASSFLLLISISAAVADDEVHLIPPSQIPTSPAAPSTPQEDHSTLEVALPDIFIGCWQGTVPQLDTVTTPRWPWGLSERVVRGVWSTKTYVFCYRRIGLQLKLAAAMADSIDQFGPTGFKNPIIGDFYQTGHSSRVVKAATIDPDTIAILMHTAIDTHAGFTGNDHEEFDTGMRCHLDGDQMTVEGGVTSPPIRHARAGWSATWHATFTRMR